MLINVSEARLGDTEESTTREGSIVAYSSRVRTLVDAVHDWARFGSLPRGYSWIIRELAAGRVAPKALLEYLAASEPGLTFKGGTCLARIHSDFCRLSEDLDFAISTPLSG